MPEHESISRIGAWEGYRVCRVERQGPGPQRNVPTAIIGLEAIPERRKLCSGCGLPVDKVHDTTLRRVRDLPIFDAVAVLELPRCRLACPRCGPKLERLSWLAPHARVTRRLAQSVARLCKVMSVAHVAEYFRLGWDAVKALDKASLHEELGEPELDDLDVIAMDEFALHRGHRYATVVFDPRRKRVLWVGQGRDRACIREFFTALGPERKQGLRAVVMDMNGAFEQEGRTQCPHVEIVFDLFHVVAKYGREVIDRVRVDEANRLRNDKPARKVIKGSRWLLLRNRENLRDQDRVRLVELLTANKALMKVYLLRDDLKHLWDFKSRWHALRFWKSWYSSAVRSRVPALVAFAKKLKGYLDGILAHCRWPFHTSLIEGINNRIKVTKRMAYGFRDQEYFFLKIRAAFPGLPG